jgi:hypothetical protein
LFVCHEHEKDGQFGLKNKTKKNKQQPKNKQKILALRFSNDGLVQVKAMKRNPEQVPLSEGSQQRVPQVQLSPA